MQNINQVGDDFDIAKFLQSRELTVQAVNRIAAQIEPGMEESDGYAIIDQVLEDLGSEKKWHPNKFRIGINTTKSFRDISEPNIKLQKDDIFFVDIGPVFFNHEGDYGATFTLGHNHQYKQIADASKSVFESVEQVWRAEKLTGQVLYQFAEAEARRQGYELNLRMSGHRVADFPHALYYKGNLVELNEVPGNNLWVLEIHICDLNKKYGAFFEDIMQIKG